MFRVGFILEFLFNIVTFTLSKCPLKRNKNFPLKENSVLQTFRVVLKDRHRCITIRRPNFTFLYIKSRVVYKRL